MSSSVHIPVLLSECVDALNVQPDGVYVDGTFGGGGHSREIAKLLGENGKLISIDQDPEVFERAESWIEDYPINGTS